MNILNKRGFLVEYYRFHPSVGKFDTHYYYTSYMKAHFAIVYHYIRSLFSSVKIHCRIIGSYVR